MITKQADGFAHLTDEQVSRMLKGAHLALVGVLAAIEDPSESPLDYCQLTGHGLITALAIHSVCYGAEVPTVLQAVMDAMAKISKQEARNFLRLAHLHTHPAPREPTRKARA